MTPDETTRKQVRTQKAMQLRFERKLKASRKSRLV
jgi:hypothetical protein